MKIQQAKDGNWYVARVRNGNRGGDNRKRKHYRNWYMVKFNSSLKSGVVEIGGVYFPKPFIGKRVRFKIEIVEDGKKQ